MNKPRRRPAAFRLDDPSVVVSAEAPPTRPPRGAVQVTVEPEPSLPLAAAPTRVGGGRLGAASAGGSCSGPRSGD